MVHESRQQFIGAPQRKMTPYQEYQELFRRFVRPFDSIIAQNVFDVNFKITPKTIFYITVITFTFSLFLYTIAFDPSVSVMQCVCLMPASAQVRSTIKPSINIPCIYILCSHVQFQVFIKSVSFLLNHQTLNDLKQALDELYKQNDYINPKCNVMATCARNSVRLFVAIPSAYSLTLGIFAIWPFISYYYIDGSLNPPIPLSFPGIDATTKQGLCMKFILQYLLIILVVIGVDYYDSIFAVLIYNTFAFSGLIVNQIERLDDQLRDEKQSQHYNEIHLKFRNIILMYIEKNKWVDCIQIWSNGDKFINDAPSRYVENIDKCFKIVNLFQVMTTTACLVTTLVVFLDVSSSRIHNNWYNHIRSQIVYRSYTLTFKR